MRRRPADVAPFQRKGQLAAANQNQGKGHADGLRRHGGIGRSGCAHVKAAHQQQITGNVADTGDQHRNEGHNRITDAPENTAENVVGHDEYRTGRADAGVGHCAGKGVHRGVHDGGGLGQRPAASPP